MGAGLAAASRRGIAALSALERRMHISQARMESLAYSAGSLIGSTIRGGVVAGGVIAGAGLTAGIYKIVSAGVMFEKFRTQLEGLEGSAEAGERAMQWVTDFAARTPYELAEVMEAFISLKAYGIDPTNGTLRSLGDTAAGMGKDLMAAVEMIADAQTGEFERIKEFGIKASVEGDKVTFRWQRNGREMSKTVKQSATDIRQALLGIMDQRFAGGMERLSKTTAGKWSNLMDSMNRTAARVWEGGLGASVNKQLDRFNDWLGKLEADGSLKAWADKTGKGLGDLVATIGSADWPQIGRDFMTVAGALRDVANAIGYLAEQRRQLGSLNLPSILPPQLQQARQALDIYRQIQDARSAPQRARPATPADRVPLAPLRRDNLLPRPSRPNRPSPALSGQPSFRWPAPPKGKLEISVKTQPGTTARPTKLAASGMDIETQTGRAMGAIA